MFVRFASRMTKGFNRIFYLNEKRKPKTVLKSPIIHQTALKDVWSFFPFLKLARDLESTEYRRETDDRGRGSGR